MIYAVGLPYMAFIINVYLGKEMSAAALIRSGMLVFLPWDALKIAAAVILIRILLPVLRRQEA